MKLNEIIPVDEFKALIKSNKAVALKELRERFSDKEIRDHWGMKYDAYNYYLMQLGLKEPYGKAKEKTNVTAIQKAKAMGKVKGKDRIIDVEHHSIEEIFPEIPEARQLALTHAAAKETDSAPVTTMLNFPAVVGNAAQLRKRIESFLSILEWEGEEAIFQLKFVIDRK